MDPFYTRGGRQIHLKTALASDKMGGRWTIPDATAEQIQRGFEVARVSVSQEDAGPWVVTLCPAPWCSCRDQLAISEPVDARRSYAIVHFGNGGISNHVEVDWGRGCEFTVYGSEVRVDYVQPIFTTQAIPEGCDRVNAEAFITRGIAPRVNQATRTVWYQEIAPAAADVQAVPDYAKQWYLYNVDTAWPVVDAVFRRRCAGSTVGRWVVGALTQRNRPDIDKWHPVPMDATSLELQNNATADQNYRVVYRLAL